MEREPGDPGVPYDPEAPDRLLHPPRSAAEPPPPAPAHGRPHTGHGGGRGRVGRRAGGAFVVAGLIGLIAFNGSHDPRDDSDATSFTLPQDVRVLRIESDSDDIRLESHEGAPGGLVTVDRGRFEQRRQGNVLVVTAKDDLRLHVPLSVPVVVANSSGDITGRDLTVENLTARTDSGDVDLEYASAPASVNVETDSGDADLALPRGLRYDVDASTDSGDEPDVDRSDPDAENTVDVRTDSGDITVND